MYIIKNAWKNIGGAKGRNVLVAVIIITIVSASCVALAIRNAAQTAKEDSLSSLTIKASVGVDREKFMNQARTSSGTGSGAVSASSMPASLTIDQQLELAKLSEVQSYYYTDTITTAAIEGEIQPVESSSSRDQNAPGGGRMLAIRGAQGDFAINGVSSDQALDSLAPNITMKDGQVSDDYEKANYEAIISSTLALQNDLKVGDTVKVTNPNNSAEVYEFKISGIYSNPTSDDSQSFRMNAKSMDPENGFYVNYATLKDMVTESEESKVTVTSSDTGSSGARGGMRPPEEESSTTSTSEFTGRANVTYVFGSLDNYNKFTEDVKSANLDGVTMSNYAVSSSDVASYDKSIVPLDNLSKFAFTLLLIILLVGAIVLVVLSLFNVRERKYEIGVYTAIGIKKPKVVAQFAVELLIVALLSVGVGAGIGAAASVPVANNMLAGQVQAAQSEQTSEQSQFGRQSGTMGAPGGGSARIAGGMRAGGFGQATATEVNYISQIDATVNLSVLLQLIGIGILLTVFGSIAGATSVLRYEPLQILADR